MKTEDFAQLSIDAYERYKQNITKEQKTPKNMFKLGYQAAILEHSKVITDLQHYKDTTVGLFAIDKSIKTIADVITNELSEKFNLLSVDSFDINQYLITYFDNITFRIK